MTNSTNNISADISMNGQMLQDVTSFKYLGATLCMEGTCSVEVRIRIASAMAAMAGLNRTWRCDTISSASKCKPFTFLVTSILLCGCETWTLLVDSEIKDPRLQNQVLEETSPQLLLGEQEQQLAVEQDQLL